MIINSIVAEIWKAQQSYQLNFGDGECDYSKLLGEILSIIPNVKNWCRWFKNVEKNYLENHDIGHKSNTEKNRVIQGNFENHSRIICLNLNL